ncbi:hypothetical protein [Pedobacter psychroterrae]|uniref:Uncharacterized protein n=1 Tax=Pedobacter psychroterrae TaxID=2530453 RepID=A0A4R0NKX5_9SPHI|nr:hypothetical protein [Pedobacter psychroterrae]TCD01401.1 hypothetical protein EZ437_11690 [Pedobacter psychroterrae]
MKVFINKPSKSLQYLAITKRWVTDLDSHRINVGYLERLHDDFVKSTAPRYSAELAEIKRDLFMISEQAGKTETLLFMHINLLELMINDSIPEDTVSLNAKHNRLDYWMRDLAVVVYKTKKHLLGLIEVVVF